MRHGRKSQVAATSGTTGSGIFGFGVMGEAAAQKGPCTKLENRNQKLLDLHYDNRSEENDTPYQEHTLRVAQGSAF
jgi:hypothetical protein